MAEYIQQGSLVIVDASLIVLVEFIKLYLQEYGCKKLEIKLHHLLQTIIDRLCWGVLEEGNKGLGQTPIAKKNKKNNNIISGVIKYLKQANVTFVAHLHIGLDDDIKKWVLNEKNSVSIKMIMKPGDQQKNNSFKQWQDVGVAGLGTLQDLSLHTKTCCTEKKTAGYGEKNTRVS